MKKLVLTSAAEIKLNTGNYETVVVTKTISREVEYETADELKKKSAAIDLVLADLVKQEAETMLAATGRKRFVKPGMHDVEAPLWKDK